MDGAIRRIQAVQKAFTSENANATWKRVLILPDDSKVDVLEPSSLASGSAIHEEAHLPLAILVSFRMPVHHICIPLKMRALCACLRHLSLDSKQSRVLTGGTKDYPFLSSMLP